MAAPKKPLAIPAYAGCLVKMIFGFAVLIVMGYCALVALNPKAREWATKGAKDGSGGPTPFKAMNQILAIPAQAIGKTKDVVAAGDARVGLLDGVIAEEEGKKKKGRAAQPVIDPFAAPATAAATPGVSAARAAAAAGAASEGTPAEQGVSRAALLAMAEKKLAEDPAAPVVVAPPPEPVAPAQVKLGGGIVVSSASPAGGPVVHAAFFYWIVNQNISGVFQSPPHRIMLDRRLVYEGQEINAALGITFDHLELANKLIVFRDKTGALVTRSY
ncbi:MAG: hypothetical protein PSU94_03925 [Lacunisphaera sp.]|nr:hypothetical protein [Lacunisphaera sp.]